MLLLLLSSALAAPSKKHEWVAPSKTALRGPCPGLNVLANYGFLDREGGVMRSEDIANSGSKLFGLGINALKLVLNGAKKENILVESPQGEILESMKVLTLSHGKIEHDASISRADIGNVDQSTQNPPIDHDLLDRLFSYSSDGVYLTLDELVRFQVARIRESKAANPNYYAADFNVAGEKAALALIFGDKTNNWRMKVDWLNEFLRNEKLHVDWQRKDTNVVEFLFLTNNISKKIEAAIGKE